MDHLLIDLDRELASTRRLLERIPDGHGDWKPHGKSRTLAALATHVATIPAHGVRVLTTDEMDITTRPPQTPIATTRELVDTFEAGAASLKATVGAVQPATLEGKWTLKMGAKVVLSEPRTLLMRLMVVNHLVHHRAQLGVYLRLLDVPIPGMFGPSADEPIAP